jgi:hypothetical protein
MSSSNYHEIVPKEGTVPLMVRLPKEVHQALAGAAREGQRSLNSEVILALCERYGLPLPPSPFEGRQRGSQAPKVGGDGG